MDFVIENYIWFLIIGVILVMALIGYIAEKTDFVKEKEPKEKKPKKQKKHKKDVEEVPQEIKDESQIEQNDVTTQPEVPQSTMTTGTAMDWELPSTIGEVSGSSVDEISNDSNIVESDMNVSMESPDEISSLPTANLTTDNSEEEEVVDLSDVTTQLEPQLAEAKFQIAPEQEVDSSIEESKASSKKKKNKKKKVVKETSSTDDASLDDIWKF